MYKKMAEQKLFLIVDLESTCWSGNVDGTDRRQTLDDMEVIEFGCVISDLSGEVMDSKSFFVKPQLHPILTDFCTELTTITQEDVNGAPCYSSAVKMIDDWLEPYELLSWASWGNYDKNHLTRESERNGIAPDFLNLQHENLKKKWSKGKKGLRNAGPKAALEYHGLTFEGSYHRGIDDALNIARLLPFIEC